MLEKIALPRTNRDINIVNSLLLVVIINMLSISEVMVHIPEFNGQSYLEFDGLGRSSLLFLEIELVIKPMKPDGVILYNGYTQDRQGDFLSLAMVQGHLEFRFDLGTGPAVLR